MRRDVAWLMALAAVIRLPALATDFWLDEIISYERFAMAARSVGDLFVGEGFRHDNNHHLNTLWLYLWRDHDGWMVYRIPAVVCGIATLWLAVLVGSKRSRAAGNICGLLVAVSFMMVVYSTEARGYGLVMLFALLAFHALDLFLSQPSWRRVWPFWLWVSLGLMSHLAILHFYYGALLWSGFRLRTRPKAWLGLHAWPAGLALTWAAVVLRGGVVGGGDPWTWHDIGDKTLAWTLGYPLSTIPPALVAIALAAVVIWGARRRWRSGSDDALFYVGAIAGPALATAAIDPPYLFPRYFLISLLFLLLMLGQVFAELWRSSRRGKWLVAAAFGLIAVGNMQHLVAFARDGRGHASQMIAAIAANSSTTPIRVTSPSVGTWSIFPIRFYERKLELGNRIEFFSREQVAKNGPPPGGFHWIIVPTEDGTSSRPEVLDLPDAGRYARRQVLRAYGPSGMHWFVYEREDKIP